MAERIPDEVEEAPPAAAMPRWVPVLIGGVLVLLAGLAVYTGLRYRSDDDTLAAHVRSRPQQRMNQAPSEEPGAGASLILPGDSGNAPAANARVQGSARAVITGDASGVASTVRMWARRGMVLDVQPGDALVYVNDLPIGEASQFNSADEVYDFAAPGSYTVRIVAPGGAEKTVVVTAGDDAAQEVATIAVKLE